MASNVQTVALAVEPDSLSDVKRAIDCLLALVAEFPDMRGEVRDAFLCGGKLRPGMLRIHGMPTAGAGNLRIRFDLTDEFREAVLAFAARDLDRMVVQKVRHGASV